MRNVMVVMAVWLTACTLAQSAYFFLIEEEMWRGGYLFDPRFPGSAIDWYSALILFGCAALMVLIAGVARQLELPHPGRWAVLALVFFYLSADEGADLHERLNNELIYGGGFSRETIYPWIVPALILVILLGAAYLPFVRDLPQRIRRLVIAAGATYLTGALALEVIETTVLDEVELSIFGRTAIEAGENLVEMLAMTLFAYALLLYLTSVRQPVRLEFGP